MINFSSLSKLFGIFQAAASGSARIFPRTTQNSGQHQPELFSPLNRTKNQSPETTAFLRPMRRGYSALWWTIQREPSLLGRRKRFSPRALCSSGIWSMPPATAAPGH